MKVATGAGSFEVLSFLAELRPRSVRIGILEMTTPLLSISQTMATNLPEIVQTVVDQAPRETWPILAGICAFGSTLAISTLAQWRILGISTGSLRPLPTAAGFATVCAASLASHHASIAAHEYVQNGRDPASYFQLGGASWNNAAFSYREEYLDLKYFKIPLHTVRM
jgi:hypothetical protein